MDATSKPIHVPIKQTAALLKPKNGIILHSNNHECNDSISNSKIWESAESRCRWMWRHADAVAFDVDSTVLQEEAIDELAKFVGVAEKVAEVTKKAMNGGMGFRDALKLRLGLMRPHWQQIEQFLRQHPPKLTPGIAELIEFLHEKGVHVYLISGGFTCVILPVAEDLGIPGGRVFANELQFDEEGNYAGFDESRAVSDSGGKGVVCSVLKQDYRCLMMVGDGMTDYEACGLGMADGFIGFGGNQVRKNVKDQSDWFVYKFAELLEELDRGQESESD